MNNFQIRIEYTGDLPESLVSQLNQVASQHPNHHFSIHWDRQPPNIQQISHNETDQPNDDNDGTNEPILNLHHPRGYQHSNTVPVLRAVNHCQFCLCAPCVIASPPDFLMGSSDPHPANSEKRHRLYRLFWRFLRNVGLWQDEEYLARKAQRTVRDDRRGDPSFMCHQSKGWFQSIVCNLYVIVH